MALPNITDALEHLGIDEPDEAVTRDVSRALDAARHTLYGSVGADVEQYLPDDPRATELVLVYLDDLYDERGVSAKVSGAVRHLVQTLELQLRLELRAARERDGGDAGEI